MSTTIQTIQTIGDNRRRDATSGAIDSTKKLQAVNDTLQIINSRALWDFTTRTKVFNFYDSETDYSLANVLGVNDFRDVKALRLDDSNNLSFTKIDPGTFDTRNGQGNTSSFFTVEYRLGDPILRLNTAEQASSSYIGSTTDHDEDGTWTADTTTSDATNIATNTSNYRYGGGSVSYDTIVGQSVNNQADVYVTTTSQVDLSSYVDIGGAFVDWYLPAVDQITGATLRWGSSDSAYYSASITTGVNNSLAAGWNRIMFDWANATTTGSPDSTALDYYLFRTSYGASQTTDTGYLINGLKFVLPTRMELLYYSSYIAKNSSGTWLAEATATSDSIIVPDRYREVVVDGYVANLLRQMGKSDEAVTYETKFEQGLKRMSREHGTFVNNSARAFSPRIPWNS